MTQDDTNDLDPEILAISQVNSALRSLDAAAQRRVLDYVARKLNVRIDSDSSLAGASGASRDYDEMPQRRESFREESQAADDDLDGISPVAKKWMRRSGFSADQLGKVFSLGVDDIDLVAKKVPGTSKRDKMRSVILLKGVAEYLATGAARVTYEKVREACLHYGAFDNTNFSKYLKSMASEVSGAKDTGYTITARGLTSATELVTELVGPSEPN